MAAFSLPVMFTGGLIVEVYPPGLQIVEPIVACVTAGLVAPGVHAASGSGCFAAVYR
ncbi:hypothetical protein GCM10009760_63110 [Kitasatospora kazusensis]|uniref:Uncharacterized protein n=1 Tax=Kitasatospora kazusensis TaxID=407974 RepID=A0ABN1ZLQ2_9ACTN